MPALFAIEQADSFTSRGIILKNDENTIPANSLVLLSYFERVLMLCIDNENAKQPDEKR